MKAKIQKLIKDAIGRDVLAEVSVPQHISFGHYSTNVAMRLAQEEKKSPVEIAKNLAEKISYIAPTGMFQKIEAVAPGFINFWLSEKFLQKELLSIYKKKKKYGESNLGKGKKVIVEYASLNIAKEMHVGYLRNISIGDALANAHEALGYKVIRWNYLGDWGTQFGNLIAAYKWWGDRKEIEKNPIKELNALYVRFHKELKEKPQLEAEGREEFRKLEEGDKENKKLWQWFKIESLKEFHKTLKTLGVRFDLEIGESFFEKEMEPTVKELLERKIAKVSEGAVMVPLDRFGLPPALVRKSDGGSLYLTRDLANLKYRIKKYNPNKILYVVGNEQALHFEQVFRVSELMGLSHGADLEHVKYGLVHAEGGGKFSTRGGNVILLNDVVGKAAELAGKIVEKKNSKLSLAKKKSVAGAVALGALKYANLKEYRTTDVVFDWDKMIAFSGDSGPYLEYAYARLTSIIKKAKKIGKYDLKYLSSAEELAVMKKLLDFPEEIAKSAEQCATNNLTLYLYEFANLANRFYETTPILKDEVAARRNARLVLIDCARSVLKKGLGILGIGAPEEI